ncbi:hypothetical protein AGR7A_Cc250060 [Agrobacterium deltaense NCPPB 1641]|uniref:Transposase n=1 Tax=Agrobacterium deltaense NCPPB 1641 TaxID=1183425 RepID=A0A1S7TNZ0_9HYPH|nr:hypothetical protein AGR7A_Cc250060 [Agrobacterium deltaense NCPPB 1641]
MSHISNGYIAVVRHLFRVMRIAKIVNRPLKASHKALAEWVQYLFLLERVQITTICAPCGTRS